MNARKLEAPDVSRVANSKTVSWYEASARQRVRLMLDAGSFQEFIGPEQREQSPHLRVFDLPTQFDDGIVVGRAGLLARLYTLLLRRGASWAAPSARFTAPS